MLRVTVSLFLAATAWSALAQPRSSGAPLGAALTFHAAFDGTLDAVYAAGDPRLYSAKDRRSAAAATPGVNPEQIKLVPGAGRHGDAVRMTLKASPLVFYRGQRNIQYEERDWSGTVSVWLSLDPDKELAPGYSDPLIITPRSWDDASMFVDFTRDDVPRRFRFAAFADKAVWNPGGRGWDDVPVVERPMIEVARPPFASGRWTHVAWTWSGFNADGTGGVLRGYLDGKPAGTLTGRRQMYTWNPAEVLIALGVEFNGLVDELAIFNRALSDEEIRTLHTLAGGVASLKR
jgi:hypothetical protein